LGVNGYMYSKQGQAMMKTMFEDLGECTIPPTLWPKASCRGNSGPAATTRTYRGPFPGNGIGTMYW